MTVPTRTVSAMSWSRFNISGLDVVTPLAGAVHRFQVGGLSVEVRLPDRPSKKPPKPGESWGNDKIDCHHWRGGRAFTFSISSVDVLVDVNARATVPAASLERVNVGLFNEAQRRPLDKIARQGETVAAEAFDHWLRMLRWKTLNGLIGQKEIARPESGWGLYLLDRDSRKRFYAPAQILMVPPEIRVTRHQWNQTADALTRGAEPPVWFDFLFEGQHRVESGDLHGGIICLAIACETVLRIVAMRPANRRFFGLMKRLKAMNILEQWKNIGFTNHRWQQCMDTEKLKRLFQLRNSVMHEGTTETLTSFECGELAYTTRRFIVGAAPVADRLRVKPII